MADGAGRPTWSSSTWSPTARWRRVGCCFFWREGKLDFGELAKILADSSVRRVLVVLECCHAGAAGAALKDQIKRSPLSAVMGNQTEAGAGIFLLAGATSLQEAQQGQLVDALLESIDELGEDDPGAPYLQPALVSQKVNGKLGPSQETHCYAARVGGGVPSIIRNPHHDPPAPAVKPDTRRRARWGMSAAAIAAAVGIAVVGIPVLSEGGSEDPPPTETTPQRVDQRKLPPSPSAKIRVPAAGDRVGMIVTIEGRASGIAPGHELRIVVRPPGGSLNVHPQPDPAVVADGAFTVDVILGDNRRESLGEYVIRVVDAAPAASRKFREYIETPDRNGDGFADGLSGLPSGARPLADVDVVRTR